MGIRYLDTHAVLEELVSVEDAEALCAWLRAQPVPAVDMGCCRHVHAAVLQVLLALRPAVTVPSPSPWLARALAASAPPRALAAAA